MFVLIGAHPYTLYRRETPMSRMASPINLSDEDHQTLLHWTRSGTTEHRMAFRAALYMGALVASRFNPVIRDFYQRLLAAGKPRKLALTACMRKLLVILNSVLKHGVPWRDLHSHVAGNSS